MRLWILLLLLAPLAACDKKSTTNDEAPAAAPKAEEAPAAPRQAEPEPATENAAGRTDSDLPATVSELLVIDQTVGDGAEAVTGSNVSVHYTGWLYDPGAPEGKGNKFDSSLDRGQPFQFPLGQGRVIKGWDEGVAGMLTGGKRRLIIPSDMAYGERGFPPVIPANATLLFDVELLAVQ